MTPSAEIDAYFRDQCWRKGVLSYKLRPHQVALSDILWQAIECKGPSRPLVTAIDCSRKFGKSTVSHIVAFEFALRNPHANVRFITTTASDLRQISEPIVRRILEDCPPDMMPRHVAVDGSWHFHNGATMFFAGADNDRAKNQRGRDNDLIFGDEAAFIDGLRRLTDDVLIPSTMERRGLTVLTSTPAETPDSDWDHYCEKAKLEGWYFRKTIDDNTSLDDETKERYIKEAGGRQSTKSQREYFCEHVTEAARVIVPEWRPEMVVDYPRPGSWGLLHKYVAIDVGVSDFTAALFGYYDFPKATLVIEDEEVRSEGNVTTKQIAEFIREKEAALWGGHPTYRRISDVDLVLVQSLTADERLPIMATSKDKLPLMVNDLRILVGQDRLRVHPRCVQLIGCLRTGIWDKHRAKFQRSGVYGHLDALAALMYLVRNLDQNTNPIPVTYGTDPYNSSYGQREFKRRSAYERMIRRSA